jgi:hypothetical protein
VESTTEVPAAAAICPEDTISPPAHCTGCRETFSSLGFTKTKSRSQLGVDSGEIENDGSDPNAYPNSTTIQEEKNKRALIFRASSLLPGCANALRR